MKYVLFLIPFLATPALAQEDLFKGLSLSDRIQITFRSGGTITGQVVQNPGMRKKVDPAADPSKPQEVDFSKENEVTLDLGWEYPGLNGTMTIPKREIKDLRKLQNLDQATLDRLRGEKKKIEAQLAAQNAERRAAEKKRDEEARQAMLKLEKAKREAEKHAAKSGATADKMDRLKKGMDLMEKYPSSDWGPDRLKSIAQRAASKFPVTPDEQEFVQNFDVIQDARNAVTPDKGGSGGSSGTSGSGGTDTKEKPPEEQKP
jgi:hypothetical protein